MAGRRPKPAHLHVVQGTHRPDRHGQKNAASAGFERGAPDMPDGLSDRAAAAWERIVPQLESAGVLALADSSALQVLCEAWADWMAARDSIERDGLTYTTESTAGGLAIKANPAATMKADADRRIRAWLVEFGLTPSSRTKLAGAGKSDKPSDPWDDF